MKNITQAALKELIHYNPDTGIVTWLHRPEKYFKSHRSYVRWNNIFAGTIAGSATRNNARMKYVRIDILGYKHFLHRIAYLYMTGLFPEQQVDHVNGDSLDNRWLNLRAVSKTGNRRNLARRRNNTSGYTGVSFSHDAWIAGIGVGGKTIHLGRFKLKEDAVAAREAANIKYGFHPNHGKR